MDTVDRTLTPITVKLVARSRFGWGGIAAASASAADAPQIAVAPPERRPNWLDRPSRRAATIDTAIVIPTEATMPATGCQPSELTSPIVIRRPSRATPQRSTERAVK